MVQASTQPIKAAGALVYAPSADGLRLLLIKDRLGRWTLPKGHCEPGEKRRETAVREVAEETGIACTVEQRLARISYPVFKRGAWQTKQVVYFLAHAALAEPTPLLEEGIETAAWFPPQEALQLLAYANLRRIVADALVGLGEG